MIEKVPFFVIQPHLLQGGAWEQEVGEGRGGGAYTMYIGSQSGAPTIWRVGKKPTICKIQKIL